MGDRGGNGPGAGTGNPHRHNPQNKTNLIINSLCPTLTDHQLGEIFGKIGPVNSATVIKDRKSGDGRSLGYGFVDMQSEEDAAQAINILNGQELMGCQLRVQYSRSDPFVKSNKAGGAKPTPPSGGFRIFVQKLPPTTTEDRLKDLFGEFGDLSDVQLPRKAGDIDHCKGYAFLTYMDELDAKASIEALNKHTDEFFTIPLVVKISVADEIIQAEKKKAVQGVQRQMNRSRPAPQAQAPPVDLFDPNNPPPPPPRRRKMTLENVQLPPPVARKLTLPEIPSNCDGVTLFFYNVGKDTEETQIKQVLLSQGAGPILYVAVVREPLTNTSKNFAFVKFKNQEDAQVTIATLGRSDLFGCGPVDIKYKTYKSTSTT
jgi:RNA recognition motif-containing protein